LSHSFSKILKRKIDVLARQFRVIGTPHYVELASTIVICCINFSLLGLKTLARVGNPHLDKPLDPFLEVGMEISIRVAVVEEKQIFVGVLVVQEYMLHAC
jgi:hypothetical protein